ncbi:hypothetical protein D9M72_276040 [compost metagenome]
MCVLACLSKGVAAAARFDMYERCAFSPMHATLYLHRQDAEICMHDEEVNLSCGWVAVIDHSHGGAQPRQAVDHDEIVGKARPEKMVNPAFGVAVGFGRAGRRNHLCHCSFSWAEHTSALNALAGLANT